MPEKFHGQKRQAGYSLWGHKESDTTEKLSRGTHTHMPMLVTYFGKGTKVTEYVTMGKLREGRV